MKNVDSSPVPSPNRVVGGQFGPPSNPPGPPATTWWGLASSATSGALDVYLSTVSAAAAPSPLVPLYDLTGPAALPPRHAFGFMATYWGFRSLTDVTSNMSKFRDGSYPIDTMVRGRPSVL